jgi:hypothetical protein
MILGFTGTRKGMSEEQKYRFLKLIFDTLIPKHGPPVAFHHGDCVGADADAHHLIVAQFPACCTVAHPADFESLRAFVTATEVRTPTDSKSRNANIVRAADIILACPLTATIAPSGTWQTINMALRSGKEV